MMLHTDLCYGQSAQSLADLTGTHITTTRRWKRGAPLPEPVRRLLRILIERDLAVLSRVWDGWMVNARGALVSPEGWEFTPGEVRSIPFLHGMVSAHQSRANAAEARLQWAVQADWVEGRYVEPGETHDDGERPSPITVHHGDYSFLAPGIARRRARGR